MLRVWLGLLALVCIASVATRGLLIGAQPIRSYIPLSGQSGRDLEIVCDFSRLLDRHVLVIDPQDARARLLIVGSSVVANRAFQPALQQALDAGCPGHPQVVSVACVGARVSDQVRLLQLANRAPADAVLWLMVTRDLVTSRLRDADLDLAGVEAVRYDSGLRQALANYRRVDEYSAAYLASDLTGQLMPWRAAAIRVRRSLPCWPEGSGDTWSWTPAKLQTYDLLRRGLGQRAETAEEGPGSPGWPERVEFGTFRRVFDDVVREAREREQGLALGLLPVPQPDAWFADGTGDTFRRDLKEWCEDSGAQYMDCATGWHPRYTDTFGHIASADYPQLASLLVQRLCAVCHVPSPSNRAATALTARRRK